MIYIIFLWDNILRYDLYNFLTHSFKWKVRQWVPVGRVSCIHTLFTNYWVKNLDAYKLSIGYPIVLKNHFNPVT